MTASLHAPALSVDAIRDALISLVAKRYPRCPVIAEHEVVVEKEGIQKTEIVSYYVLPAQVGARHCQTAAEFRVENPFTAHDRLILRGAMVVQVNFTTVRRRGEPVVTARELSSRQYR